MASKFIRKKRLGSGYFGEVWLARDRALLVDRAVKFIPTDKVINPTNLFQEAQLIAASRHQNVIDIYEAGYIDTDQIYISMEYLPKGSIENETHGAPMYLSRAKRIMVDLLRGLAHLHSQSILHRDIKPANILIADSGEARLSDLGLAIPANVPLKTLGVKDYNYIRHLAPELIKGGEPTVASDIYASGVTSTG